MASQAIARVRALPERRDNRRLGLRATRRRGMQPALAWVPFIRGQLTVMDDGKTSEGLFPRGTVTVGNYT